MNRILLFILLSALTVSCSKPKDIFRISGYINNVENGETILLATSPDGFTLNELSRCVVKNQKFCLNGTIENSCIGYIYSKREGFDNRAMFFVEKGRIEILIDSVCSRAIGTPLNDLKNAAEDTVKGYIAQFEDIEKACYSIRSGGDTLVQLGAKGLELQERLLNYLYRTTEENVENPFGLYMLIAYNEFFTTTELYSLMTTSEDVGEDMFYRTVTDILHKRQR